MLSIDSETTGLDHWHGAAPYFVTTCDDEGRVRFWEWDVDPLDRKVAVDPDDAREISALLKVVAGWGDMADPEMRARHRLVAQNGKFDAHALCSVGIGPWPWGMVDDTLVGAHLLASNQPHDLTALAMQYLEHDIQPLEDRLKFVTEKARRFARRNHPNWALAKQGMEDMPSMKGKGWKIDAWLPRALAKFYDHPAPDPACDHTFNDDDHLCSDCGGHEYWSVLAAYANGDSAATMGVWLAMRGEIARRGLTAHYEHRLRLAAALWRMEHRGVTVNADAQADLLDRYSAESGAAGRLLARLAAGEGYELKLPKGNRNDSLTRFCFGYAIHSCDTCGGALLVDRQQVPDMRVKEAAGTPCRRCTEAGTSPPGRPTVVEYPCLDLPVLKRSEDTGAPSMDKEVMSDYLQQLDPDTDQGRFVAALAAKRKRDMSVQFLESYARFWRPHPAGGPWRVLHPSANQTGTDTLRLSMSNPNAQQVDKHPDNRGATLRAVFGPAPGREWWKMDYQNLELRIPAFEADEAELVNVFLHPDDPPYYGSYHLVVFDVLHPQKFKEFGKRCKDEFAATWYQWVKNGNFSILYGAMEKKADATYHVKGAYKLIRHRFPKMAALSDKMLRLASKNGYVETMPSKLIDPARGYPLMVARSSYGNSQVEPTKPLNYHVQGTACETANLAMVQCDEQLAEWRAAGFDAWIPLYVHDELVFDFPKGGRRNLPKVRRLAGIMEAVGDGIGVPLKVDIGYCPTSWAKAEEPK